MMKLWSACCIVLFSLQAGAEDREIAEISARQGLEGTMVVASLHDGRRVAHNDSRANRRLPAASTFKILNTLIALEEKAIAGKDDVLRWDGRTYALPAWNRDQTLESAFRVSCVWCYRELARRVGAEAYRRYLHRSAYGELSEPFDETAFWLDGSLRISAVEQVKFLEQVYRRTLPFSVSSYETLRQIMLVEQTPAFAIRAKTGWAASASPQIGWYVGYVETPDDVWFFAMNLDVRGEQDLAARQAVTREVLIAKGIVDRPTGK